jgi:hypothetical protein
MRRLHATKQRIPPRFFGQNEVDFAKVEALKAHIAAGGEVPPVVVAQFGEFYMAIDGHHRLTAARDLGVDLEAWVVLGSKFDALDAKCRDHMEGHRAEDFIMCGGVPALTLMVAPRVHINGGKK